ncbi:AraC family transcriptional regulator [Paenibacillus sp. SYP-B3998]|uniref:AraC family transcriptional regulator n=1 Tax=Paenibacillus sp. SYP-B3998 TaxID=2678564 RepID=A0A6G3ZUN6_9BACL|nr:AraC family transcriptional regulator [Paenibacillus sp. SYP-B3998]NEW05780.1 AraC family transcriptional regulator [Paenibacillus sp. SYP-B3998]
MQITNHLLYHKLSDLRVKLIDAKRTVCPHDWIRFDFIPEYNKFYYICDGNGWIKLDGKLYRPQAGQLFFAPAGVLQSFSVTNEPPYTMYWCHFTSNYALNQLFRSSGIPNLISVEEGSGLLEYFRQLIDNRSQDGLTTSIKIQSALFEIIAYFIDHARLESYEDVKFASMNKLVDTIKYIDANLDKEITIHELSQTAHFHPNYFIRFFKNHLGVPPMRYIYDRRLERAKELLGCFTLSINEVARRSGFNDASHFSTSFKKHVGVSPTDFRNLYTGNDSIRSNGSFLG